MKYDTRVFTNIGNETFLGIYDGKCVVEVSPNESRYLPSHLSEHFAEQLIKGITNKIMEGTEEGKDFKDKYIGNKPVNKDGMTAILRQKVLGEFINTKSPETGMSLEEEVIEHERMVKRLFIEQEKEKKAKEIEAEKIIRNIK